MNQEVNILNNTIVELRQAIGYLFDGVPNSDPFAKQVNSIKKVLKSKESIFSLASHVEQYVTMKRNIAEFEREDCEKNVSTLKSLMQESVENNLSSNQIEKIAGILTEINLEQPAHTIMVAVGRALKCFADELNELREASNVTVSNKKIATKETDFAASDVLASKSLIRQVVAISKQLTQTYPDDKVIRDILHDVSKTQSGKASFLQSTALAERLIIYLALITHKERCSAEVMLNDIQTNLESVFRQTSIIGKWMTSTKDKTDEVKCNMVSELQNMEVKAKNMGTLTGFQEHINQSVLLMSDIMNNYANEQSQLHQANSHHIKNMKKTIDNAHNCISKLENKLNVAEEINLIDELTKVGNRKGYTQAINKEQNNWLATQKPLAILLIDVDRFKSINDTFGHSIGDQVLKSLAKTLKSAIRSSDYIARYGGDEFIIILPEADLDKAIRIAKKIRKIVNSLQFKLRTKNKKLTITCSFGLSTFTNKISNASDVFNAADDALYQVKDNGRDAIAALSKNKFTLHK